LLIKIKHVFGLDRLQQRVAYHASVRRINPESRRLFSLWLYIRKVNYAGLNKITNVTFDKSQNAQK